MDSMQGALLGLIVKELEGNLTLEFEDIPVCSPSEGKLGIFSIFGVLEKEPTVSA